MKERSLAMELLHDANKRNKRQFIIIIIILVMWFLTIGYLVYVLNDYSTVETTTTVTQDNAENNNYIGNDGDIVNGTNN